MTSLLAVVQGRTSQTGRISEDRARGRVISRVVASTIRPPVTAVSPPEPGLTPDELIARAVALRPRLIEQQAECEERTYYSRGAPPGVRERRLLPALRAPAVRRLRVRRPHLRAAPRRDRARLRQHRLVHGPRGRTRAPGRLLVGGSRAGGDLRRRRLPGRGGGGADRARHSARGRLRAERQGLVLLRDPVLDALHGPGGAAGRERARHAADAALRRAGERVDDARRLGRPARDEGLAARRASPSTRRGSPRTGGSRTR